MKQILFAIMGIVITNGYGQETETNSNPTTSEIVQIANDPGAGFGGDR